MGKSCGLKKVEQKGEQCPFNVLRCKGCKKKKKKKKRVGSLSFVINMKETVKQLCFNFQGCEFRGLITVRSYL